MSMDDFSAWYDSDEVRERKTLRGIREVVLSIEIEAPEGFAVSDVDLEALAATRLHGSGIVLEAGESWDPESVVLSVSVSAVDPEDGEQLGFVSEVSVIQSCVLLRDSTLRLAAKTWTDAGFSVSARAEVHDSVLRVVGGRIDRFLHAYLAAQSEALDN